MVDIIKSMTEEEILKLYQTQEIAYNCIKDCIRSINDVVLVGGTPLARCYLNHRVSFDLDFVLNPLEDSIKDINNSLKKLKGCTYLYGNDNSDKFYASAFYRLNFNGVKIDFSFVEDKQYKHFKKIQQIMGSTEIDTVDIDTLYYNKLRTIGGDPLGNGRTKARDFFDLFVLSRSYKKLDAFLDSLPKEYKFDVDKFYDSLVGFNWYDTLDQNLVLLSDWKQYDTTKKITDALFDDINSTIVDENFNE